MRRVTPYLRSYHIPRHLYRSSFGDKSSFLFASLLSILLDGDLSLFGCISLDGLGTNLALSLASLLLSIFWICLINTSSLPLSSLLFSII